VPDGERDCIAWVRGRQWMDRFCEREFAYICKKQVEIHQTPTTVDFMVALEPPMPTLDLTCSKCDDWDPMISGSEDESSCSEVEDGHMTCNTREICGETTYQNS
jgi:hypothetical protein